MSLRRAAAAALLLLPLTACGGDEESRGATTLTPPKESSAAPSPSEKDAGDEALSQQQLESALLTLADLPAGYTQGTVSADDDSPTESDNPECAKRFDELDDFEDAAVAKAEVAFEGSEPGTILEQALSSYRTADEVSDQLARVTELFSECPSFSFTDAEGTQTDVTIEALSFPKLGDETAAFALGITTPDFEAVLNVAAVRVGQLAQLVSQGGLSADIAALEQAARKGTEKLEATG